MQYTKYLASYYVKWFQDCHESAIYCLNKGDKIKAKEYLNDASKYLTIIMENWYEIDKETKWPN